MSKCTSCTQPERDGFMMLPAHSFPASSHSPEANSESDTGSNQTMQLTCYCRHCKFVTVEPETTRASTS